MVIIKKSKIFIKKNKKTLIVNWKQILSKQVHFVYFQTKAVSRNT